MTIVTEGLPETQFPAEPDNIEDYLVPPKTDVPNVISLEEGSAVRRLRDAKLNVSVRDVPSLEPAGIVVRQSIGGGATVDQGTTVTIWVSNGETPVAPLPSFSGLRVEEANELIEDFEIETGVRITLVLDTIEVANLSFVDRIYQTNPPAGAEIIESASIVAFIGVAPQGGGGDDDG